MISRKKIEEFETAIIRTLVEDALDRGYVVRHNDGEDWTALASLTEHTTKEKETKAIMDEIRATDEESLHFWGPNGKIGSVLLVYGNDGYDVIADHTATDEMDELVSGATELSEHFQDRIELEGAKP